MKNLKISIVVPIYNEFGNLKIFYESTKNILNTLPYQWEILFVDDGSTDDSKKILFSLAENDSQVKIICLSKNYGHQLALTCGMDYATGDAIITMDGDFQHPPTLIPKLIALWEQGYEIVQTIRKETKNISVIKKITSKIYYKFINLISRIKIKAGSSDFRLLDKKVLIALKNFREHARFLRGIIPTLGFKQTYFYFVAPNRLVGKTKFSLKKMINLALNGILTCSVFPLRLGLYMGIISVLFSFGLTIHVFYETFITKTVAHGWPTIVICFSFFGGIQLMLLGMIGEYIGRIYEETKKRPLYLITYSNFIKKQ